MPSSESRLSGYRRGTPYQWHVALRRLPTGACLLALALTGGGCSLSYQLENMHGDSADQTGSLRLAVPRASAEIPPEGDLAMRAQP
jgi:hypothetical protein